MVIDNGNNSINTGNPPGRSRATGDGGNNARSDADKPPAQGDTVALSTQAKLLSRLAASLDAQSETVNQEHVDAIKKAIEQGRFEVNAQRIAERMLDQDSLFS